MVCLDYGVKRNILRLFSGLDCKVTVLPATASTDDVLALKPDGIFLSNGPAIRRQLANTQCLSSRTY